MGKSLKKKGQSLERLESQLNEQRESLQSPEDIQQWQQQWDRMLAAKEALQQRYQRHLEMQQQHLVAKQKVQERREREQLEAREREMARARQELERKEQVRLQRRQAMVERREQMSELALSRKNIPVTTLSFSHVLQLVLHYLAPVPGPNCTLNELLSYSRRLQTAAAINQEWRAVALPLFYRTAYVIVGSPLNLRAMDDSDDEELLNTVGLPGSGVGIDLRTNIDILYAAGQIGEVRDVQIVVQGMGQTADQLLSQLQLAGVGRHVWAGAERLRIDMRDSGGVTQTYAMVEHDPNTVKALNDLLSTSLPSLREIEFYGPHSKKIYGCVLIEELIMERLQRPASLRAVRVKSDCWPELTDNHPMRVTDPPIYIECVDIDGPDEMYLMPIPIMFADTLVELKLNPAVKEYLWRPFESESALDSTNPVLLFPSLRKLTLNIKSIEEELPPKMEYISNHPGFNWVESYHHRENSSDTGDSYVSYRRYDNSDGAGQEESEEDAEWSRDDAENHLNWRFGRMYANSKPCFPVLTSLELHDSMRYEDLEMFADSPISSLVLRHPQIHTPSIWDLSMFSVLRSLSIPIYRFMEESGTTCLVKVLSTVFSTVCPELQHLSLAMTISKDFWLQLTTPLFADSLVSLTLEGEYGQDTVENFLQLFPNLHRLRVCAIFSEPIFSVSDLICEYSLMCIRCPLKPLNSSLRILEAYGVRLFSDCDDLDFTPKRLRLMAPELYHYRGILVGLLYRLPALDTLRVGAPSVDGVNEDIDAIVATNVGPEHINLLQRLRIRPLDY